MGKRADCIKVLSLFLIFLFGVIACAGAPPEVNQLFWQLDVVLTPETDQQHEELSLFLMIDDADGIDDIEEFIILQREAELEWRLSAENTRRLDRDGETWMGVNGIRMHNDSALPRGRYTVEVFDKAGEKAETAFYVENEIIGIRQGPIGISEFPRFDDSDSGFLSSPKGRVNIRCYNEQGAFVRSETVEGRKIAEDTYAKWIESGISSIWLHTFDEEAGFGLVSGPFRLTRE